MAPTVITTRTVGKDLGYDSKPWFAFDAPFWKPGTMWRNLYFSHKVSIDTVEGNSMAVAICIPYLCRNAVLHAYRESTSGASKRESMAMHYVRDPYSYRFWTYDFVMHWAGGLPVQNGTPSPKNGSPVWVEIENYDPTPCSDFADQGPWVPALPADYTWLIHPSASAWNLSGGGGAPSLKPYSTFTQEEASEKGKLDINILDGGARVHGRVPATTYFLGSPDPYVGVFYRDACKAVFGQAVYANVSEDVGGRRKYWGHSRLVDHDSAHHFIGVIQE